MERENSIGKANRTAWKGMKVRLAAFRISSTENSPALLIKREVGSIQPDKSKPPQNVPNIYVLNKEGYKQEIEWALNKMKEIYEVDEFYPIKNGNHRFK